MSPEIKAEQLPHWETHGGQGPYLLLVHGFLSSRAQWQPNLGELTHVCRPVTVELFGHARSPSPDDPGCYHPEHYTRCFEQIRRNLGAERWFVLGYSLGAGLTIQYALSHPERVYGHLFTNSTSGFADAEQLRRWKEDAPTSATRLREGGTVALERIPVHPRHARRLPEAIRHALLEDAALHDPRGIALTLTGTNPHVSVRERVGENTRPACLLFGERERRFHEHAAFASDHMPNLEVVRLDAGHGVNMEQPAAFNAATADFIRRYDTA